MDCSRTNKRSETKKKFTVSDFFSSFFFFLLIKSFYILHHFIFQGLIHEMKNLTVLGSLNNLPSSPIVIYYFVFDLYRFLKH